jgi:hypothetical protein
VSPARLASALLLFTLPVACREAAHERQQGAAVRGVALEDSVSGARRHGAPPPTILGATLWSENGLDAARITVDTVPSMKTIRLTGTVNSAPDKTRAGRVAAAHAVGYRVLNLLQVRP